MGKSENQFQYWLHGYAGFCCFGKLLSNIFHMCAIAKIYIFFIYIKLGLGFFFEKNILKHPVQIR